MAQNDVNKTANTLVVRLEENTLSGAKILMPEPAYTDRRSVYCISILLVKIHGYSLIFDSTSAL